jgi:hypothetical protein
MMRELFDITCFDHWASETRGSEAAGFYFGDGLPVRGWFHRSGDAAGRALPVRSGK